MGVNRYLGGVITANQNPPTVESASGTWTLEEAYQNIGNWPMALNTVYDSLKFNSADSAYLSRTPTVAGNKRTWTYSCWAKRTKLGAFQALFNAYVSSGVQDYLVFTSDDELKAGLDGATQYENDTNMLFRDPGAWYHIVWAVDTTQLTAANRSRVYVNGTQVTFQTSNYPPQNTEFTVNSTNPHYIGYGGDGPWYADGYLTEINFIDGLALDADYFGFFDANGIWQPRAYKGAYGTNGFYLPMRESATASGFSTVTYTGTGTTNNVTGVGFAPDFVWIKNRSTIQNHLLVDIVRGSNKSLSSSTTNAEATITDGRFTSFNSDGFTVAADDLQTNYNGDEFVGWCWDAGSSTVTNNDGTITSTVRANQTYGFSIVTYAGSGTAGNTVGHGLGATPSMVIVKNRTNSGHSWAVRHVSLTSTQNLALQSTDAAYTVSSATSNGGVGTLAPTTFTFISGTVGLLNVNATSNNYVAYCFSEIAGYSKFGSYTGTGSAGNSVTLGFKPAFVVIKQTNASGQSWYMADNTRDPVSPIGLLLEANSSGAEFDSGGSLTFTNTGFTINETGTGFNANGSTYIYMAFADTRAYSAFDDYSGNGNNWQPNNIGTDDVYVDVPTNWGTDTGVGGEVRGNYTTWNAVNKQTNCVLANGNLNWTCDNTDTGRTVGTIAVTSGKWYWEVTQNTANRFGVGVLNTTQTAFGSGDIGSTSYEWGFLTANALTSPTAGQKIYNGSATNYGSVVASGETVMIALDADNGNIYFGKNGTWFDSSNPATSTSPAFTGLSGTLAPSIARQTANGGATANFGATPFAYTAPSGFKALCTQNLPEPTIADGEDYMDALLWTGNGSTQNITGLSFQPDLVWTKDRGAAYDHTWFDAVRGATKFLRSNATSAEETQSDSLTSFNSNGFSVGADAVRNNINKSGASYVSWNWKANGAGVSNTAGTINSTVSANTTAGFSIVTYTGTGSAGTIGHGLGAAPRMVIVKQRNTTRDWAVYHSSMNNVNAFLILNSTASASVSSSVFGGAPTSTVFSVGTDTNTNQSTGTYVAYVFAPVTGFSAFGSYAGTGSAPGAFSYLGFRPAFIMIKEYDGADGWGMYDKARNPYNAVSYLLQAQDSGAESSAAANNIDFLSNGFRVCTGGSQGNFLNESGKTYVYAAFAESPFKISRAR